MNYKVIYTLTDLRIYIKKIQQKKYVSFDTETNGLDPFTSKIVGISLSIDPGEGVYIPIRHKNLLRQLPRHKVFKELKPMFEDPEIIKAAHNMKFDYQMLKQEGIKLTGGFYDTQVMAYLIAPNEHHNGLNEVAEFYLGHGKDSVKELIGKGKNQTTMDKVAIDLVAPYAVNDAALVSELVPKLLPELDRLGMLDLYVKIELPLIFVLADMELAGIKINVKQLEKMSKELEKEIQEVTKMIHTDAGGPFLISSPKQLGKVLFEKLQLRSERKTKTGQPSTDNDTLEELKSQHWIVPLIIKYRHLSKLKSTYVDALPTMVSSVTGRVHTNLWQTVTATGRLSSSEPNLQNIPIRDKQGQEIRRAFIAEPGHVLLVADYSQIELRILAHLSGDQAMIHVFNNGGDIHAETAEAVFKGTKDPKEARFRAKIINFSINYGTSIKSLAKELGTTDFQAKQFMERYFWKYSRVREYQEEIVLETEAQGYSVTLLGRKRPVPEFQSEKKAIRAFARRVAMNNPIQGSAADVVKIAMLQTVWALKKAKLKARLLLQVHDELIFEVPKDEVERVKPIIRACMEDLSGFLKRKLSIPIPVNIGVGDNWIEAKE